MYIKALFCAAAAFILISFSGCTQEQQNQISRSIQNWTGTNGVLDVFSEGKVLYRFIKIDKMTTATATGTSAESRSYRFGYGVIDLNMNFKQDPGEKKVYFEVSDFATSYVFYENPHEGPGPGARQRAPRETYSTIRRSSAGRNT